MLNTFLLKSANSARNHKAFWWSRFLSSLMLFASASQGAVGDDYLDMDLEQLLQVKVTGSTLSDESLKTVPSAVTVFSRDQLDRLGVDYLYELLNLVPGYQFDRGAETPTNYTFSSRGRRNGTQAREVLVVMDGRLLAGPRTGSVDIFLPLLPLEQIERIEIIRGPGSAIYGSSAFNGVINIITRTGQNRVRVEAGSDNRRSLSLSASEPLAGWASNLFVRAYEDAGQKYTIRDTFSGEPLITDDPRKVLDVDAALLKEEAQWRFAYHSTDGKDFYSIGNTWNGFNNDAFTFKQLSVDQQLHWFNAVNTHLYLGYLDSDQHLNTVALGKGALALRSQPASSEPLLVKAVLAGDSYNLRLTNDWIIDKYANALLGLEWKREKENDAFAYNNYDLQQLVQKDFPIRYYGDFSHTTPIGHYDSQEVLGIYGQYLRDVSEATRLTLGMRYDHYAEIGNHVSPRLGLVHQLNANQTFKLLYGEAYRAPSLGEIGVTNNPLIVGNPNLRYEIVKTWDAIWIAHVANTNITLGGFRNDYRHPIIAGFIDTTRTVINGGDEHSNGVELELQQNLNQQWSLRATYTTFFSLPQSAFREAKHLASAELNFNQDAWNWNLLAYRQGARYTLVNGNIPSSLDSFTVFNSKLRYRFEQGHSVSVQLKNVSDLDYETPAQNVSVNRGVVNRGREVSVILDWDF